MNIPDNFFESLETFFWVRKEKKRKKKYLNSLKRNRDLFDLAGAGIRDGKFRIRVNIPDPQHCSSPFKPPYERLWSNRSRSLPPPLPLVCRQLLKGTEAEGCRGYRGCEDRGWMLEDGMAEADQKWSGSLRYLL
jgi:hypothetical protein